MAGGRAAFPTGRRACFRRGTGTIAGGRATFLTCSWTCFRRGTRTIAGSRTTLPTRNQACFRRGTRTMAGGRATFPTGNRACFRRGTRTIAGSRTTLPTRNQACFRRGTRTMAGGQAEFPTGNRACFCRRDGTTAGGRATLPTCSRTCFWRRTGTIAGSRTTLPTSNQACFRRRTGTIDIRRAASPTGNRSWSCRGTGTIADCRGAVPLPARSATVSRTHISREPVPATGGRTATVAATTRAPNRSRSRFCRATGGRAASSIETRVETAVITGDRAASAPGGQVCQASNGPTPADSSPESRASGDCAGVRLPSMPRTPFPLHPRGTPRRQSRRDVPRFLQRAPSCQVPGTVTAADPAGKPGTATGIQISDALAAQEVVLRRTLLKSGIPAIGQMRMITH